jgi:hypothetical protein
METPPTVVVKAFVELAHGIWRTSDASGLPHLPAAPLYMIFTIKSKLVNVRCHIFI